MLLVLFLVKEHGRKVKKSLDVGLVMGIQEDINGNAVIVSSEFCDKAPIHTCEPWFAVYSRYQELAQIEATRSPAFSFFYEPSEWHTEDEDADNESDTGCTTESDGSQVEDSGVQAQDPA
jgi:hypothetical protein